MSSTTPDGVDEAVTRDMQMMLMAATQLGEKLAQRGAERRQQVAQAERGQQKELQARWEAHRAAARQQLSDVTGDQFWERNSPDEIAQRYVLAQQWAEHDEVAYRAVGSIEDQLQQRHGLSPQQYISEHTQAGRDARAREGLERIQGAGTAKWWDRADMLEVSKTYRAAVARADDPQFPHRQEAAAARDRIAAGLREHTGMESPDDLVRVVDQQTEASRDMDLHDLDSAQWWEQASGPQVAQQFAHVHTLEDGPRREALDAQMRQEMATRYDVFPASQATTLTPLHTLDIDESHLPESERVDRHDKASLSETLATLAAAQEVDRTSRQMPVQHVDGQVQMEQPSQTQSVDALMNQLRETVDNTPEGRDGINARRLTEIGHGVDPAEALSGGKGRSKVRTDRGMEQGRDQDHQLGL